MVERRDLLIEIGTEELPPKVLKQLSEGFGQDIAVGLRKAGLSMGSVHLYATPRRLAVLAADVVERQPDRFNERRGPALKAAFDDEGNPSKAALGFARSCGVPVRELDRLETEKGAWLVHRQAVPGRLAVELFPDIVRQALSALPIPKRMRWGNLQTEFVRPVHWTVLLFGDEVIEMELLSVSTGRNTYGHRFHHPGPLWIPSPTVYTKLLKNEGYVLADFEERREAIRGQVTAAACGLGGQAVIDEALLEEVTGLVEWPVALVGRFEPRFLKVPSEVLVATLKGHLKYFHMLAEDGSLMPYFVTVSNIESRDPQKVIAGNERVIRPRLADAAFFFHQDLKQPLEARFEGLGAVVFHESLGTLKDKAERIIGMCGYLAQKLRLDQGQAERAGVLSKCDLLTEMVSEWPELQGVMGRYYARHAGEPQAVAAALDEQYKPRFAGDELPSSSIGQVLALADRIDTLTGTFAVGRIPTGDKDPFGLRRAAVGVLRIIIEKELDLDLKDLLGRSIAGYNAPVQKADIPERVLSFILERLRGWYMDAGIRADVFEAVMALRLTRPLDIHRRIEAVMRFRGLPEAESLAVANKRVHNILKQAQEEIPETVALGLLQEVAEHDLYQQLDRKRAEIAQPSQNAQYTEALTRLADLRNSVDTFFDEVMVMVKDQALRRNRLALLQSLRRLFLQVADISQLQGEVSVRKGISAKASQKIS